MKETAFLYFHISLFACSHNTCSPASDYIRCIRTRVFKMQTPDMLKIPESGLIHFLLYWLRYKKKNGCVIYYPGIASTAEVPGTPYKKRGTEWNFVPLALRRLLPDLRPKLARAACSNKGLRSDAMLAHKANSNVSAYSVRGFRNFYLIGSVTIIKTVQS